MNLVHSPTTIPLKTEGGGGGGMTCSVGSSFGLYP